MINFEQYLAERKSSSAGQQTKRKVNIEQLKQMIANKDPKIANVDVSEITDMKGLFEDSDFGGSWTADLSEWDTSKVEDMSWMFVRCKNLKEVSLPHTENVKDMSIMFGHCTILEKVSLPHTENVKDMSNMFQDCTNIKEVALPNTGNVTNMGYMFCRCKELTKVELPNTEKVEDMRYVFNGCENLQQDFSSWDITNVRYKDDMFRGCTKMQTAKMNGNDLYPKGYK